MVWRQKVLVIEKRIPCGGSREEDSPITIWKEGFKRKGGGDSSQAVQSSVWGANRKNGLCLCREFGGYVRVTLVNVCGSSKTRRQPRRYRQ